MATTIASGHQTNVYFKEELTYGCNPAVAQYQYLGPVTSAPFKLGIPRADVRGLGSRIRVSKPPLNHIAEFSVEVPLQTDTNWLLIQDIDDAVGALKYYSISITSTIGATTYYLYGLGAVLEETKISANVNELIMVNLTFSVQRWAGVFILANTYGAVTWEPAVATTPQVWKDGYIEKVGAGWTAAGVVDEISAWEITIKNNYKKRAGWTQLWARDAQVEGFDVSGSITFDMIHLEELTELINESEGDIDFYTEAVDKITALDVTFDSVGLDLDELVLLELKVPFTADDVDFTT